jgi:hypothetical protein
MNRDTDSEERAGLTRLLKVVCEIHYGDKAFFVCLHHKQQVHNVVLLETTLIDEHYLLTPKSNTV